MKYIFLLICFIIVITSHAQDKTEQYIEQYKHLAIIEMKMYSIPASITLSQGILESGNGESKLAVEANNHFGIKCHNNWKGKVVYHDDDEENECFRKYQDVEDSFRDHSLFLVDRSRYNFLFEYDDKDYRSWAKGLSKAGYATNPEYSKLLINLINKYNLDDYDIKFSEKRFYFGNTYGFPYIIGIGSYYVNENKLISYLEGKASIFYHSLSIGYNHKIFNNFFGGINSGVIYFPNLNDINKSIIPQISTELAFLRLTEKNHNYIYRLGLQFPLKEDKGDSYIIPGESDVYMPYIGVTYLIK